MVNNAKTIEKAKEKVASILTFQSKVIQDSKNDRTPLWALHLCMMSAMWKSCGQCKVRNNDLLLDTPWLGLPALTQGIVSSNFGPEEKYKELYPSTLAGTPGCSAVQGLKNPRDKDWLLNTQKWFKKLERHYPEWKQGTLSRKFSEIFIIINFCPQTVRCL